MARDTRSPLFAAGSAALALTLGLAGCASVKPPILAVDGLHVGKVGITGAALDVSFRIRNPNPEPLYIERFEYELFVNGNRLGRGFQPSPLDLPAFEEQRVSSRFDLSWLQLPGAVKSVLDQDRARARVKGTHYVRHGDGLKKLGFEADAEVDIRR